MRRIKKTIVMLLMAYLLFANCIAGYAAEKGEQEYYLLYMYDQDNGASVEIGTHQIITNEAYKDTYMDNLILFPIETGVYHPFQMEQLDEAELKREIREYLLYAGYARIEDEAIAEDYELEAQEHAKQSCLGGWKDVTDEQEETYLPKKAGGEAEENLMGNCNEDSIIRLYQKLKIQLQKWPQPVRIILVVASFLGGVIAIWLVADVVRKLIIKVYVHVM